MSNPKILYVDDEPINLLLFEANLEKKFSILTALSGSEGIEIFLQNNDIRVVFSDMRMPGMNGLEFIKKVNEISPGIPCYLLTGYEITDLIQEALNHGLIRKYFKKPFDLNEIASEIESVLKETLA